MATFGVGTNPYIVANGSQATAPTPTVNPQQNLPKCNMYWVDGEDEVLGFPTTPNEQTYYASRTEPIMYVRETDANGKIKNPLKILRYSVEEKPFGPEANFVTKEEHRQLYDLVEKLGKSISDMDAKLEKFLS